MSNRHAFSTEVGGGGSSFDHNTNRYVAGFRSSGDGRQNLTSSQAALTYATTQLSDDANGAVAPAGLSFRTAAGVPNGIIMGLAGLYLIHADVGIDTSGSPFTVFFNVTTGFDYYSVQYLDPVPSDKPHRIATWSGVVPSDGTSVFEALGQGTGGKVLSVNIYAFPLF